MSKAVIRLGDPTDHGGAVVAVSATHHTVDGLPVARVGEASLEPARWKAASWPCLRKLNRCPSWWP